jgi:nitrite reductase/ring-hydroxylating ferredoxin subunit/uncharacterized membrane protein
MTSQALDSWLDRQRWLDTTADAVQPAVLRALDALGPAGRHVKNFLHGSWLGHPLHPVLTDVPLGAWTMTVLLDAVRNDSRRPGVARAADMSLAVGLAGAAGAAVTGLADWSATGARPRRAGVAHAALNVTATLLFTGSLVSRGLGDRSAGRGLAVAGYLVAVAAAYLGGHLVFNERIGVDHSAGHQLPEEFTRVLAEADLPEGRLTRARHEDTPLLLVKRHGRVHALVEACAHQGGPLADGKLEGDSIVCPWHGSRFALEGGTVIDGPSAFPQTCLEARIRDGHVEVRAARSSSGAAIAADAMGMDERASRAAGTR